MVISMLLVFAQLFQNAIYYQLLIKGKLKYRLNKNKVTEIDPNMDPIQLEMPSQPKPASPMTRSSSGKSTRKRKEFLSFLTKVQVDRTCHEYRAMRFNSFSRVAFCVVLILFISIYWPYVIKKGQIYNLNKWNAYPINKNNVLYKFFAVYSNSLILFVCRFGIPSSAINWKQPKLRHLCTNATIKCNVTMQKIEISLVLLLLQERISDLFHSIKRPDHHHGWTTTYDQTQFACLLCQFVRIFRIWGESKLKQTNFFN